MKISSMLRRIWPLGSTIFVLLTLFDVTNMSVCSDFPYSIIWPMIRYSHILDRLICDDSTVGSSLYFDFDFKENYLGKAASLYLIIWLRVGLLLYESLNLCFMVYILRIRNYVFLLYCEFAWIFHYKLLWCANIFFEHYSDFMQIFI